MISECAKHLICCVFSLDTLSSLLPKLCVLCILIHNHIYHHQCALKDFLTVLFQHRSGSVIQEPIGYISSNSCTLVLPFEQQFLHLSYALDPSSIRFGKCACPVLHAGSQSPKHPCIEIFSVPRTFGILSLLQ